MSPRWKGRRGPLAGREWERPPVVNLPKRHLAEQHSFAREMLVLIGLAVIVAAFVVGGALWVFA